MMNAPIAYIGPGAGFALGGSLLTLLLAVLANVVSILAWPFRALWGAIRHGRALRRAKIRKLIFIGFDGLDPRLTERWMAEGKLPNLARLRETGGYGRLRTTYPALSPVAWSTFATGVNPGKHNIFDFLNRGVKSYMPELSMAKVTAPSGRWRRPTVESRRRSESFWTILGRHQIQSTILRVPVTFPAEKFNGRMISAMSTPDLKGTQGSFSLFTTSCTASSMANASGSDKMEGGFTCPLKRRAYGLFGWLDGPAGLKRQPFCVRDSALHIQNQSFALRPHEFTPWIKVRFGPARGIVRFLVTQTEPEFTMYASSVQMDPESPALPISHPAAYSVYLAKLFGSFATQGMAEDTWALNEGVLGERDFLSQAYSVFEERRTMFADALAKTRRGVAGCVFDTSDRVQHMFFREMSEGGGEFSGAIEEMYRRMDAVVGETLRHVDSRTLLLVLSDHGFRAFNRGVNLNAWLREHGYLSLMEQDLKAQAIPPADPDAEAGGEYFEGVDWKSTRAYALGLGGLYLNLRGREPDGIVEPGDEARQLKAELIRKLTGLKDGSTDNDNGACAIANMYDADAIYTGPYLDRAPDLIAGFNDGYRTAWGAALGRVSGPIFETNDKAWSGDHCVDPPQVPGVLFANRKIDAKNPGLEDLAPTILQMFGVDPPAWMEGKPVFQ
jgi:predicted AlkP superfamily phosphohydrolase/phosphomutase